MCYRPQVVVSCALWLRSQVVKITTNPVYLSRISRRDILLRWEQTGSGNCSHTSNSARDHHFHGQIPPSFIINSPIPANNSSHIYLPSRIPIDGCMCAVWLNGTVRTRKDRDTYHCLFFVAAYAHTDCSWDKVKDELYMKLSNFIRKS